MDRSPRFEGSLFMEAAGLKLSRKNHE